MFAAKIDGADLPLLDHLIPFVMVSALVVALVGLFMVVRAIANQRQSRHQTRISVLVGLSVMALAFAALALAPTVFSGVTA